MGAGATMSQTKYRHGSETQQALNPSFNLSYVNLNQILDFSEPVSLSVKPFKVLVRKDQRLWL